MLYESAVMGRVYWVCSVEMRVNSPGATFKVKGEGSTPTAAADACSAAMQAAIDTVAQAGQAGAKGLLK